ncbi:unnamed protein product [Durusdinium trenchii]|uniref:Uncharacterized protein n=1 Tax=Durusdinium trenchii TaxID=1381693 RepID=A0ABP0PNU5_9DINO
MRPNGSSLCVPNGHMSPCELASPSFSAYSGIAFIHLQTPLPSLPSKTTKHANIQPPPARFSGVSPCIADGRLSVCGSSIRINPSPCIAAMGCCGNKAKVQEPSKDSKVETPAEADTNPSGGAEPTDDPSAKAGGEEWVEEMVGIDKEATIQMLVCIDWMETSGRTPEPLPSLSDTALRNAKAVRIPEHVVTLGSWAFDRCLRMILVEIPNSVTSIQNEAFSNCKSLAKVVIPDSVAYLGSGAFRHCHSLASVILSKSLTGIERNTFEGCESLVELAIPGSVTKIMQDAFANCSSLESITIPELVVKIGVGCFRRCRSLSSLAVPKLVTQIERHVFAECSSLISIVLPDSVSNIGHNAFGSCSSLACLTIPESVTRIEEDAFANCGSLAKVVIPDSVAYIGPGAFCHCCSLASVILSESLTGIERNTFEGCESLVELAIPSSVMQIHPEAFTGCRSLADMPSIQPASEMPGGYRRSEKSEENRFAWIGSHVLGLDLLALRRSGSLSDPTRERMERCCVAMGAIDQNQSTNQSARVFV